MKRKILIVKENPKYLSEQILTYIGNKRTLLGHIGYELDIIRDKLSKDKITTLDLFAGSGIVSRFLKQYSDCIHSNDLETYSKIINECYLSNKSDFDENIYNHYLQVLTDKCKTNPIRGIISQNYSPLDDKNIKYGERTFYTNENAILIDSMRKYIDEIVPENYYKFFLARLLIESSIHTNTSGIFKGFYKDKNTGIGKFGGTKENALSRITKPINLSAPILSNFETDYVVHQENANILVNKLKDIDVAYLDPPYNQHPYGSNYFMLNVIAKNAINAPISKVSGIPNDWNHSDYNKKQKVLESLENVVSSLDSKYLIISYNNEGFIPQQEMETMLKKYGSLKTNVIQYIAFRGSRNLKNRSLTTNEFLFILHKK